MTLHKYPSGFSGPPKWDRFILSFSYPTKVYLLYSLRVPINYLLVNLAVADIMFATFITPQYILSHTFTHPDGMTGTMLCKLLTGGNFAWVGAASSVFTLANISIERYYAVMYPLGSKGKLTEQKLMVSA